MPTRPIVCLACRSRKVKCIRPEGSPERPCEFCSSLGLDCQVAPRHRPGRKPAPKRTLDNPAFSTGTHKRGSRIMALIEQQQQQQQQQQHPHPHPHPQQQQQQQPQPQQQHSLQQRQKNLQPQRSASVYSSTGTHTSPGSSNQAHLRSSRVAADIHSPSSLTSGGTTATQPPTTPQVSSGRYDYGDEVNVLPAVRGLTRPALDACIDAFFMGPGRVFHLSLTQTEFMRRYEYLACLSFRQAVPIHLLDHIPLRISPLLVLSVAARGAPFVDEYQHLMEPMSDFCTELMVQPYRLAKDGADAVESIYLFSQGTHSSYARSSDGVEDPLKRDPLGRGFAVDLALFHKLNEVPAPGLVDEVESQRRCILFFIIFIYDAFRSAAAGRMYRIASEDVGWPTDVDSMRNHPWAVLMMAARRICREVLSPKARVELTLHGAHELLDAVYVVPIHLGVRPDFAQDEQAWLAARNVPLPPDKHRARKDRLLLSEQFALLTTWNWLYLVLWIAFTRNPSLRQSSAGKRVSEEALKATERMGQMASRALRDGDVLSQLPRLVRDHLAAFTLWIMRLLSRTAQAPSEVIIEQPNIFLHNIVDTPLDPPDTENQGANQGLQHAQLRSIADTLIEAVRAIRVPSDSNRLADVLQDMIHRALCAHRPAPAGHDGPNRNERVACTSEGFRTEGQTTAAPLPHNLTPNSWRDDMIDPLLGAGGPSVPVLATAASSASAPPLLLDEADPLFSFDLDLGALAHYDPIWSPELLSILEDAGMAGATGS